MPKKLNILVAALSTHVVDELDTLLRQGLGVPYTLQMESSLEAVYAAMCSHRHSIYIVDCAYDEASLAAFLAKVETNEPIAAPVVLVSDDDIPVLDERASKCGICDFVVKNEISASQFERVIRYAIRRKHAEATYRRNEQHYHLVIDAIADGIITIDAEGSIVYVNPAAETIFGYSKNELLGVNVSCLMSSTQGPLHDGYVHRYMQTGDSKILGRPREVVAQRREGGEFPLEIMVSELRLGQHRLFTAVVRDVTQRKHEKEQLRLLATAFETHTAIMITDKYGGILQVNAAFSDVTGYSADEVIGKNPRLLRSGKHDAEFYQQVWDALSKGGRWEGEIWNKRKNGELYPQWETITAVVNDEGDTTHYVATFQDITDRKRAQQIIEHQAFYDELTRLPNRRLLLQRLKQELSASRRHHYFGAVLFLDLDHFKELNDKMGHDAGDELLIQMGQRLSNSVRAEDTVARLGGDEFVILLPHLGKKSKSAEMYARQAARKIRDTLAKPYHIGGEVKSFTSSIGITLFPGEAKSEADVLKQADTAMYAAKSAGRNTFSIYHNPSCE